MKWVLVAHTGAMFTFQTMIIAIEFHFQSISYIDNRGSPAIDGTSYAGPLAYMYLNGNNRINTVPSTAFLLNNLLADGLLVSLEIRSAAQVLDAP